MAYIGSRPDNVISRNAQNEYNYTATGGQTTFTGADSNNNTLSYTPGNIEVYFNGARLEESDFTATNGTSIVLANAAVVNDELSIVAMRVFEVGSISNFNTSDLAEGSNLYFTNARADARIAAANTDDLSEGSTNLYFTNARADARIAAADTDDLSEGSTNLYFTNARVAGYLSSNDFDTATNIVASITDSAPSTLDTLNELAAALGDDANFSTTVTNSIATKLPLSGGTITGTVVFNSAPTFNTAIAMGSSLNVATDIGIAGTSVIDSNRRILAADGAENVPYITFAADTNTGLYRPGTDTLGFSTAGSERMRINSLGNVGIGSSTGVSDPVSRLNVRAANNHTTGSDREDLVTFHQGISAWQVGRGAGIRWVGDVSRTMAGISAYVFGVEQTGLAFETGGATSTGNLDPTTRMVINHNGNVGIGTTSPSSPLHVSAAKNDGWLAQLINTGIGGDANGLDIHAGVDSSDYILRTREQDGTDVMVVKYGGKVGIGTTSPSAPIDVVTNSTVYAAKFTQSNTANGDGVSIVIGSTAASEYALTVRSDAGNTSVLAAKADGKVGIGVFTPDYALDVRGGTSTANGARIKTGDNGYDGLIVSNSSILKCYPAAGQSVSLQAYNSGGSTKTGVKVTGANTPAGEISTKLEFVTELLGHNVYDNGSYGTSNDQYVDLEDWSPTDFRILEIFGTANPNSGGSGAYADPVHMYVYNGSGWNGAEVTYYVYGKSVAPLARDMFGSGSGSSGNVAEVWWYNPSTTAQQDAATSGTASGYHLRLKFPNTNTNTTMISLKVIKRA